MKELNGYTLQATDGTIGKIEEVYFDERTWTVRYLVVNVGNWLLRQRVLLIPSVIQEIDTETETAVTLLTQDQIEESPDIDTHKPISHEMEETLHTYYDWRPYWENMPMVATGAGHYAPLPKVKPIVTEPTGKPPKEPAKGIQSHLRSTKEVTGYHIHASDGAIGHVETFLVDTLHWMVRYVVVDTRNWLPGKKVLISPTWVSGMRWADSEMYLKLSRDEVKASPEYDPDMMLHREYEVQLYRHYHQTPYWHSEE
jgi:hypothetical protein